jgi:hypothetical protein
VTLRSALAAVAENVLAPLLAYAVLTLAGLGTVAALVGSAALSALVVAVRALRTGTVPMLGVLVCVQFLLGVVIAGVTGDARLVLAKEALGTLVSATIAAGSLLGGTPMLARIHRDFVDDRAAFDRLRRDDEAFRRDHVRVTAIWAVGLFASAAAVVLASLLPPLPVAVVLSHVVTVPVYLGLITWTVRRFRRRAPGLHGTDSAAVATGAGQ